MVPCNHIFEALTTVVTRGAFSPSQHSSLSCLCLSAYPIYFASFSVQCVIFCAISSWKSKHAGEAFQGVVLVLPPGQGLLRTGRAPDVWKRRCPGDPRWHLRPAPVPCPSKPCVSSTAGFGHCTQSTLSPGLGMPVPTTDAPVTLGSHPDTSPPGVEGGLGSSWLTEWVATVVLRPANLGDPCFGPGSLLGWGPPGDRGEKKAGTVSCSKLPGGPSSLPGRGLLRQQWRGRGRTPGLRHAAREPQVAARFSSEERERPLSPPSPSARLHFLIVPLFWCRPPPPRTVPSPWWPPRYGRAGSPASGRLYELILSVGGSPLGHHPICFAGIAVPGPNITDSTQ